MTHVYASLAGTVDIAQVCMIVFIGFVLGLFVWLHREDKREGYPLEDPAGGRQLIGWPAPPPPKVYRLLDGTTTTLPKPEGRTDLALRPAHPHPGSAFVPTGDPMQDGVGPASWAMKKDEPLLTWEGHPQVRPLRAMPGWGVDPHDPDPRGHVVFDAAGQRVGTVVDLWHDNGPQILRYLEIALEIEGGVPLAMVPIYFVETYPRLKEIRIPALFAHSLAAFPQRQADLTVTAREEDRFSSFCQGGYLYGDARRSQPLL